MANKKEVSALYNDVASAERAVNGLLGAGFAQNEISVLMSEQTHGKHFGIKAGTKAAEGAASGGAIGGAVGAVAATLAAIGLIAIPGIGLIAAGPLVAALAGAGAGAAAGGVTGGLIGMGLADHEAKLYGERIAHGSILVGVRAEGEQAKRAVQIFKQTQGTSIRE